MIVRLQQDNKPGQESNLHSGCDRYPNSNCNPFLNLFLNLLLTSLNYSIFIALQTVPDSS